MTTFSQPCPDPHDELTRHLPAMRAFAISLTRNVTAADDLVQDSIVNAWTNLDKFQPGTNLRAWLFTVQRNTFYSNHRKRRREVADPEGLHAARLFQNPAHDGRLAFSDFLRAFAQLSPEHREVLVLIGASDVSYEDAAAAMGVPTGTVKSRASRARARLCALLGLVEGESLLPSVNATSQAVLGRAIGHHA